VVVVNEPLRKFVGASLLPRSVVVKRVSSYARENGCVDEANKGKIVLDKKMKAVFGDKVASMTYLEIGKLIGPMVVRAKDAGGDWAAKAEKGAKELEAMLPPPKEKKARGEGAAAGAKKGAKRDTSKMKEEGRGIYRPLELSKELGAVCGEKVLSRPEIVKAVWGYIKKNNLQSKKIPRGVVCDAKMKKVFGNVDVIDSFQLAKHISNHVTPVAK